MIYTITFNPAIDYYISFNSFVEGELNIPVDTYKLPGGKGINVSKVLKNYGVESTCFGFVGGFTGKFIQDTIEHAGIKTDFISVEEDTRINIKINNQGLESEIAGIAPEISPSKYKEFLEEIKARVKAEDIVVLSGSIPKSLPTTAYKEIIEILPKGTKVILDTRGEAFDEALTAGVYLVKPNHKELNEYFKMDINTEEGMILAGKTLQEKGAKNVIISLGAEGSIFLTEEGKIYRGTVPAGTLISSVGAGDSMVAGFIYGTVKDMPIEDTYRFAIASGSATAFSLGFTDIEKTTALLDDINIRSIGG